MRTSTPHEVWNRTFICATLVNFFVSSNYFALVPVTVMLTADRYGASLGVGGFVAGVLLLGALLVRPFVPMLIRGRQPRNVLSLCASIIAVTTALCLLPVPLLTFAALRLIAGFGFGVSSTMALLTVIHAVPPQRRGEGTGLFGLSQSLAGAVGPAIGLFLAAKFGHEWVLVLVVGLTMAGFFAARSIAVLPTFGAGPKDTSSGFSRYFEPAVFPLCLVAICTGSVLAGIFSFIDPWAIELDLAEWGSTFFLAYSAMVICSRPIGGRLIDRRGAGVVMVPSFVLLAIGGVQVAFVSNPVTMVLAGLSCGLSLGLLLSGLTWLSVAIAPEHRAPVAASTYYLALDGSVALAPVLLGAVIPHLGYPSTFVALAGCSLMGMIVFVCFNHVGLLSCERRAQRTS